MPPGLSKEPKPVIIERTLNCITIITIRSVKDMLVKVGKQATNARPERENISL
jgi:hypothetical protein